MQLGGAGTGASFAYEITREDVRMRENQAISTPGFTSTKRSCAVRFEQQQFHPPIVARAKVEADGRPSCALLNG
jgi:hypothetical protein